LMRRILILAEGKFSKAESKTANCVIRYLPRNVAGVIDSTRAGKTAQEVLGFGGTIPVVGSLREGLALRPTELLIGIAPRGGEIPAAWRRDIEAALRAGVDVANGLHAFLSDDARLVKAAKAGGTRIRDLRKYESPLRLPKAKPPRRKAKVVLTVGTDCNVGKMTAAWELVEALKRRGKRAAFVATGQTGIYLAGWGVPVDAVKSDFVAGAVEEAVSRAANRAEYVVVEGQGTIHHPAYSGVALGILHGARPDALLLCHETGRSHVAGYPSRRIPPLRQIICMHEDAARWVRPAKVRAVALNRMRLTRGEAAEAALSAARKDSRLPVHDPVTRKGADALARIFSGK
jgi:uncharacterized NAD-dependent epimerase/dehydratase family protein